MKNEISIELNRIKSLMSLINEQGSADINMDRLNRQQLSDAPSKFGVFDNYVSIKIGEGTDYPTVLPTYTTQVIGNPNPILKQSGSGTKASDFISNVKVDEKGNEYIERKGKKYCLPSKQFWDAFNSRKYVYQIINPRNNKKFTMKLKTVGTVSVPVMDENGSVTTQELKGLEAAIKCLGGDNGWGFEFGEKGGVVFWSKDGKPYNTNDPEDFDLRSDFDVWWDKWGIWVEIGLGVLAAWTGAGLAASLLRLGFFANTGLAATYGAGNTTWLSVVLQASIEAGIMAPIATYQFSRNQDSDAILTIAFSFLPFLTELGAVQKYIKGGIQPSVSKSLGSKFLTAGGESAFKNNPTAYGNFLNNLTTSELMLWKATIDQFSTKESQKAFSDALGKYLKENETRITNTILGNKGWIEQMDDLTAGQFSKGAKTLLKQNPITGTGILAQFIRLGLPLAGVVISFQKIYNTLKSHGYDDTQIEKITNEVKKSIDFSGFLKKISDLNSDLTKKLTEELFIKYVSDKNNTDKILNGVISSKELTAKLENAGIESIMEDKTYYDEFVGKGEIPELDAYVNNLNNYVKVEISNSLEEKGHTNVTITDITPLKKYRYNTDKVPSGEILIKKEITKPKDLSFNEPNDIEFKIM